MPSPPSHNMHSQTQALKIFFTNETPVRMTLLSMDPTYEELQVMIHRQGQYDDTKQNITYWDGEDWCRCQADEDLSHALTIGTVLKLRIEEQKESAQNSKTLQQLAEAMGAVQAKLAHMQLQLQSMLPEPVETTQVSTMPIKNVESSKSLTKEELKELMSDNAQHPTRPQEEKATSDNVTHAGPASPSKDIGSGSHASDGQRPNPYPYMTDSSQQYRPPPPGAYTPGPGPPSVPGPGQMHSHPYAVPPGQVHYYQPPSYGRPAYPDYQPDPSRPPPPGAQYLRPPPGPYHGPPQPRPHQ